MVAGLRRGRSAIRDAPRSWRRPIRRATACSTSWPMARAARFRPHRRRTQSQCRALAADPARAPEQQLQTPSSPGRAVAPGPTPQPAPRRRGSEPCRRSFSGPRYAGGRGLCHRLVPARQSSTVAACCGGNGVLAASASAAADFRTAFPARLLPSCSAGRGGDRGPDRARGAARRRADSVRRVAASAPKFIRPSCRHGSITAPAMSRQRTVRPLAGRSLTA